MAFIREPTARYARRVRRVYRQNRSGTVQLETGFPYFAWLDVIVRRPRVVLIASLAAFGFLATLKCSVGIRNGGGELGWSGVGLLAVGLL